MGDFVEVVKLFFEGGVGSQRGCGKFLNWDGACRVRTRASAHEMSCILIREDWYSNHLN